jgi:hypothetical protein
MQCAMDLELGELERRRLPEVWSVNGGLLLFLLEFSIFSVEVSPSYKFLR